jgi:hypothetical protein
MITFLLLTCFQLQRTNKQEYLKRELQGIIQEEEIFLVELVDKILIEIKP